MFEKSFQQSAPPQIYGIFCLHSVAVARYAALIQAKSPANCDVHLAESIFQTRSRHAVEKIHVKIKKIYSNNKC